eukprot:276369-Chlamydomonas_euryale.AAC.1
MCRGMGSCCGTGGCYVTNVLRRKELLRHQDLAQKQELLRHVVWQPDVHTRRRGPCRGNRMCTPRREGRRGALPRQED